MPNKTGDLQSNSLRQFIKDVRSRRGRWGLAKWDRRTSGKVRTEGAGDRKFPKKKIRGGRSLWTAPKQIKTRPQCYLR